MDPDRLAALRRPYDRPPLDVEQLGPDPVVAFGRWFEEAVLAAEEGLLFEANAAVLATATADGAPSARAVLLKGFDERGFVVHTNYTSVKAREIDENPRAAIVVLWHPLQRQVRVTGPVERVAREESAAYFRSRPWASRIGAWASHQSSVVADRAELEDRFAELAHRWPEGSEVPVPDFWGGLRVAPASVEFWQGRPDRMHDRLRYRLAEPSATGSSFAARDWVVERLAP